MRRDVDDAAAGAPLQIGHREPGQANRGEEQQLDRFLDELVGQLERGSRRRAAPVVYDDVDPSERLDRRVHEPGQVLEVPDVAPNRKAADPARLLLERLAM